MLSELCAWLESVFLRYPDALKTLPECWCWHPWVVEELLWLRHAWLAAHEGPRAGVALVADWHERARPGVVRRIGDLAGDCLLAHREGAADRSGYLGPAIPSREALRLIADLWGGCRDLAAPGAPERVRTP